LDVAGTVRDGRGGAAVVSGVRPAVVGDLDSQTDWNAALAGVDSVVHLAARVHVMHETERDPLAVFRQVNTYGTERLASQAAAAGVRRLVYVSTIKVNGEETVEAPFSERDPPQPGDAYATSKWEAEQVLMRVSKSTGMEVVIVRPPLVYGPGVRGNFLGLMRLIDKGVPLPVGSCHNRRSLLGLDNFVDFLAACVDHPAAVGEIFVLSDGEDLSTPDLIRRLAAAMGRPARLLPIRSSLLRLAARMVGRPGIYRRLCGSLQVDSSHARRMLGWVPPQTVDAGLAVTAQAFMQCPER
jgi:nucleoside-diphosphate-sugar epimerase